MTLPPTLYKSVPVSKSGAYVGDADKDLIMTVIPDRNLYTLLIQHAFKRTADFIRAHDLEYTNPGDQERLLAFITSDHQAFNPVRGSTDLCPVGEADVRNDPRRTARIRESLARVQDQSADVKQGVKGRNGRKKVQEGE